MSTREQQAKYEDFINPYVAFLVRGMDAIRTLIHESQNVAAMKYTHQFMMFLDPNIKKDLKVEREKLGNMLNGQYPMYANEFYDILDKLMDKLHHARYFEMQKLAQPRATTPGNL